MNTGQVLSGALRLLRKGRLIVIGMAITIMGLAYAVLDAVLRTYNKGYLDDLATTLTTTLPSNFGWLVLAALLVLVVGGLLAEGGLIVSAGGRAAAALLPQGVGVSTGTGPRAPDRPGRAVARLPQLLLVGLLVWWKLLLALAIILSPAIYWATASQSQQEGWAVAVLCSVCITSVIFLVGWFWFWPQQRLANCALLLENMTPRDAVKTARQLYTGNLGSTIGFWLSLLIINFGLVVVSLLLAGLGALLISAVWTALEGVEENTALFVVGIVALLAGVVLLIWDGAISAFNLNAWTLAYLDLRLGGAQGRLTPQQFAGTTQVLGRQREMGWEGYE